MIKQKNTLHARLFLYYGCLIVTILCVTFFSLYFYIADSLAKRSSNSLSTISLAVSSRMDDLIKQMSNNSTRILYSDDLKDLFFSDTIYGQSMDSLSSQRQFNNTFYSIMGPFLSFAQVNIFRDDGYYISIGSYTAFGNGGSKLKNEDWFQDTLKMDGPFLLASPHVNDWSYFQLPVLSLYRPFSRQFGQKNNAVIEMQIEYSSLESILENLNITQQLYILDQNGSLVYPMELPKSAPPLSLIRDYWEHIRTFTDPGTITSQEMGLKSQDFISYTTSEYTGFSVLVFENEKTLFAPVRVFRNNLLLIGIFSVIVTLLISYFISQKVTVPIRQLYTSIRKLNLDTLSETSGAELHSSLNELEMLNNSFLDMKDRLEQSLSETIASKSHEIQARMLALQSQMNPHFLYNTLTNIGIMAENAGNDDIAKTLDSLTSMLRYISDDEPGPVTVRDEIMHTKDFLDLIKIRFGENLHYDIQIPGEMLKIPLPKMVVEPLVENCAKYAMVNRPPWKLTILGKINGDTYQISVRDNGPGFTPEKLAELSETFSSLDPQKEIPNLKLDGMGIINIFIRLKLFYGEHMIFHIENPMEGGALITIGGLLAVRKEPFYDTL